MKIIENSIIGLKNMNSLSQTTQVNDVLMFQNKETNDLAQYGIKTDDNRQLSRNIPKEYRRYTRIAELTGANPDFSKAHLVCTDYEEMLDGSITYYCMDLMNNGNKTIINVKNNPDGTSVVKQTVSGFVKNDTALDIFDTKTKALLYRREVNGTQHFYNENGADIEYDKDGNYTRTWTVDGNVYKGVTTM